MPRARLSTPMVVGSGASKDGLKGPPPISEPLLSNDDSKAIENPLISANGESKTPSVSWRIVKQRPNRQAPRKNGRHRPGPIRYDPSQATVVPMRIRSVE